MYGHLKYVLVAALFVLSISLLEICSDYISCSPDAVSLCSLAGNCSLPHPEVWADVINTERDEEEEGEEEEEEEEEDGGWRRNGLLRAGQPPGEKMKERTQKQSIVEE